MGNAKSESIVVNCLRPRDPQVSLKIAQEAAAGKNPNLNQGLIPKSEYEAALKAEGGLEPTAYDPVIMQLGMDRGALFAIQGSENIKSYQKQPADWPASIKWAPGMWLSGGRHNHARDVRRRIVPEALVAIGGTEYVVGTTGENAQAAPFCIHLSQTGGTGANDSVSKALSYAKMTKENGEAVTKSEFANVVGQINSDPMIIEYEPGRQIAVTPHSTITWGHLVSDGKALTPTQIRKLGDEKAEFVPLTERWIGARIPKAELIAAVRKQTKLSEESIWINAGSQWRAAVTSLVCPGLRYSLSGQAFGHDSNADGTEVIFRVLGGYSDAGLSRTKWVFRRAQKAAGVELPKVERKKRDPKKTKKAKKAKKVKKEKAVETTATIPVEVTIPVETVPQDQTEPSTEEISVEEAALADVDVDAILE